jgi:hypothetical protein
LCTEKHERMWPQCGLQAPQRSFRSKRPERKVACNLRSHLGGRGWYRTNGLCCVREVEGHKSAIRGSGRAFDTPSDLPVRISVPSGSIGSPLLLRPFCAPSPSLRLLSSVRVGRPAGQAPPHPAWEARGQAARVSEVMGGAHQSKPARSGARWEVPVKEPTPLDAEAGGITVQERGRTTRTETRGRYPGHRRTVGPGGPALGSSASALSVSSWAQSFQWPPQKPGRVGSTQQRRTLLPGTEGPRDYLYAARRKCRLAHFHVDELGARLLREQSEGEETPSVPVQAHFEGVLYACIAASDQVAEALARMYELRRENYNLTKALKCVRLRRIQAPNNILERLADWNDHGIMKDVRALRNRATHHHYRKHRASAAWEVQPSGVRGGCRNRQLEAYCRCAVAHLELLPPLLDELLAGLSSPEVA